ERAHVGSPVSGGGGVSSVFARPSYQSNIHATDPSGRNLPDLSTAMTVNGATFALYDRGRWDPGLALGDSAPLAAFAAEAAQRRHGRLGLVNTAIYAVFVKKGYGSDKKPLFHDVTQGGMYPLYAEPGYDFATGIGTLDGFNLSRYVKP